MCPPRLPWVQGDLLGRSLSGALKPGLQWGCLGKVRAASDASEKFSSLVGMTA